VNNAIGFCQRLSTGQHSPPGISCASRRKQPSILTPRRLGRFDRRDVCASAKEIHSDVVNSVRNLVGSLFEEHKTLQNRSGETKSNKFIFATQDYRINYANMNLRHQYGISVGEAQKSLLAKRPKWRGAGKDGCFCRLQLFQR